MTEQWKTIPGFPSEYEASSHGRIRRLSGTYRSTIKGNLVVRSKPAKIYAMEKLSPKGYARINLLKKVHQTHRLIALTFIENPAELPQVNHKDGNKTNNHIENLEWVSNYQNRQHAVATGLHATGPKFNARKYGTAAEEKIRTMLARGLSLRAIAREFGTSHGTIRKILARRPAQLMRT